jgi:uncharacterized RDD family membrane protein YckC
VTDEAAADSPLDARLVVETPERVTLVYDLAGIGSRFAAGLIDVAILTFAFLATSILLAAVTGFVLPKSESELTVFGLAVMGVYSAVLALYYVGFEWAWHGQTPGKRVLRLRVLLDGGGPATPGAVFVRNVVRVADLLPVAAPYGLGGIVMFANARAKRIGDYAAGTMVVRERAEPYAPPPASAEAVAAGDAISAVDHARIMAFILRSAELLPDRRAAIARTLADEMARRHGVEYADAVQFLRALASGRSPKTLREAQGPRA